MCAAGTAVDADAICGALSLMVMQAVAGGTSDFQGGVGRGLYCTVGGRAGRLGRIGPAGGFNGLAGALPLYLDRGQAAPSGGIAGAAADAAF